MTAAADVIFVSSAYGSRTRGRLWWRWKGTTVCDWEVVRSEAAFKVIIFTLQLVEVFEVL